MSMMNFRKIEPREWREVIEEGEFKNDAIAFANYIEDIGEQIGFTREEIDENLAFLQIVSSHKTNLMGVITAIEQHEGTSNVGNNVEHNFINASSHFFAVIADILHRFASDHNQLLEENKELEEKCRKQIGTIDSLMTALNHLEGKSNEKDES